MSKRQGHGSSLSLKGEVTGSHCKILLYDPHYFLEALLKKILIVLLFLTEKAIFYSKSNF